MVVILLLVNITSVFSQKETASSLLTKVGDFYTNTKEYQIDTQYKMYKGLKGDKVTESYVGTMIKKQQTYKFDIANTEMLTINNQQVVIDRDQKLLIFRKNDQKTSNSLIDVDNFLKYYDESSIKKEGKYIRCELIAKKEKMSLPYAKITLFINPDDHSVIKQEMYFSSQLPFKLDNGEFERDFGRLVIEMSMKPNISDSAKLSFSEYFKEDTSHQKIVADTYKDYQFIDETKQ